MRSLIVIGFIVYLFPLFVFGECGTNYIESLKDTIEYKEKQVIGIDNTLLDDISYMNYDMISAIEDAKQDLLEEIQQLKGELILCAVNDEFSEWFDKGYESYENGDYLNASIYFEKSIVASPDKENYEATQTNLALSYEKLGDGYLAKTNYDKAIEYYEKYLDINPNVYKAIFNIGAAYVNLGQVDLALQYFEEALEVTFVPTQIEEVTERINGLKNYAFEDANIEVELLQAVQWMNKNGLTKFDNPVDFMSENGLRRDEATKFFVKYAKEILNLEPKDDGNSCNFKDLDNARPDLKDTIKEACQLGLFKGHNGKFMPTDKLTNAQAITVFIRMTDGKQDESGSHYAKKYYDIAKNRGLLDGLELNSASKFDVFTTRGEVGKMLYRGRD